jgi:Rps23 Pro-64 3,4-dihydroxylase Tpa1-like proline 4-hydroxylase
MREFFRQFAVKKRKGGVDDGKTEGKHKRNEKRIPLEFPLLNANEAVRLHNIHNSNLPYKHIVLDPLINKEKMRRIQMEAKLNMRATLKETDLFKVYQTGDLGNLDEITMGATLPNLLELRTAIYSADFRSFIETITGCAKLTDRVDCSANAYAQGCHLLCHDDVIGTRCVSYIIYLTDPDEEWTVEDGGALELYDLEPDSIVLNSSNDTETRQGVPQVFPSLNILPKFNSMAIFAVQPGRSYHSVQEVFSDNSPRLSISGWFHAATPPKGADLASLKQIMTSDDDDRPFVAYSPDTRLVTDKDTLDVKYLLQWMNAQYFDAIKMKQIRKTFCKHSSIQLGDFLHEDLARQITLSAVTTDARDCLGIGRPPARYDVGVCDGWTAVGPAHKRRYLTYLNDQLNKSRNTIGNMLMDVLQGVLRSMAFSRYLKKITTLETLGYRDEIRRFRPGVDYSVAHYGGMTKVPRLDATLCFVDAQGGLEELWDDGDVGGFECYIEAEGEEGETAEAAEVYKTAAGGGDDEGDLLSVSPANNVVSLVLRDEGIMRFIKYVGSGAPGSRWDVAVEFNIASQEA